MSPLARIFDAIVVLGSLALASLAALGAAEIYARSGGARGKSFVRTRRDRALAFAFPFALGVFLLFFTSLRRYQFGDVIPIKFGIASMQPWQGYAAAVASIVLGLSTLLFRRSKREDPSDARSSSNQAMQRTAPRSDA